MKMKCNSCDGIYRSFDIHFTSLCDNKCSFCIDKKTKGLGINRPDPYAIAKTIIENQNNINDVMFLGGEPCLFLNELLECINIIKENSKIKIYITTSVPKTCFDNKDLFAEIINKVDGINLSIQHYNETIADSIRNTKSYYDRQEFYKSLPYKNKIRLNINLVKPYLCKKEDIIECINHYTSMGFTLIKLAELQHSEENYVSFEDTFSVRLSSPYSNGCQQILDTNRFFPDAKATILLKRSCFVCEKSRKASFSDGVKVLGKLIKPSITYYGVIYEDGTLTKGWI